MGCQGRRVYVPISERTTQNEYLDVPNRDIETTDGVKLSLVNPAYMMRLVHEMEMNKSGISGHITSLDPIAPHISPDDWETKALNLFKKVLPEYTISTMLILPFYYRQSGFLIPPDLRCL